MTSVQTCDLAVMTDATLTVPEHLLGLDAWDEASEAEWTEKDEHLQEHLPETWMWKDVLTG